VVHLDVPETVMNGKFKADVPTWQPHQYRRTEPQLPIPARWRAAQMLAEAELPDHPRRQRRDHAGALRGAASRRELLHAR